MVILIKILHLNMKSSKCGCGQIIQYASANDLFCDTSCNGNINQICGGKYYVSVYKTENNAISSIFLIK